MRLWVRLCICGCLTKRNEEHANRLELNEGGCCHPCSLLPQFLNSAVSTIIANAHLPFLAHALDGTAADGLFFQGIYTDLTPNWYKVVGRSLVISQFVAALLRATNLPIRCGTPDHRCNRHMLGMHVGCSYTQSLWLHSKLHCSAACAVHSNAGCMCLCFLLEPFVDNC